MNESYEKQLEAWAEAALKQLPPRTAPPAMIPGVLRAIAEREARPWWRKSWMGWPVWFKVLFLVLSAVVGLAMVRLCSVFAAEAVQTVSTSRTYVLGQKFLHTGFEMIGGVASYLWNSILGLPTPYLIGLGLIVAFAYAACVGAGLAIHRLVRSEPLSQ